MHSSGFFSVVLLLVLFVILFEQQSGLNKTNSQLERAKREALEIEQLSFERTLLEHNTDFLVRHFLDTALERRYTAEETRAYLSESLYNAFQNLETQNPSLQFFAVNVNPNHYNSIGNNSQDPLTHAEVWNRIRVLQIVLPAARVMTSVSFVGEHNFARVIAAQIQAGENTGFFIIPIGFEETRIR